MVSEEYDIEWFKELTDIVKNKTVFFLPCFGAFLAFLFAKSDYIKSSNWVIWLLVTVLLFASIRYIHLVSQLLWAIESTRLSLKIHKMRKETWLTKEADYAASVAMLKLVPQLYMAEDWWFKKIMYLFGLGTLIVLGDIFFGKWGAEHLALIWK
jgi:hypothetical protein